jgi:DNA processing protein
MREEYTYWMALAHLNGMRTAKKNELIRICYDEKISIIDLFHIDKSKLVDIFGLSEKEIELLSETKSELPNFSFLVEDLLNQGFDIIPITSPDYSRTLKDNLKMAYSPPLIYTKGNKQIMKENSIAVVGSRKANGISLEFTDNVVKAASKNFKVIVSGFAKGVDKQALDSAIKYIGQSIIVLPQGIMTFQTGFKKYYKNIIDGNVLVLSTFHPKAPWSVQLAMARNPIIYGLAKEIYVAESSDSGGTWSGVMDGLKKGRKIFVRAPKHDEKNANDLLIKSGAVAVNDNGNSIENYVVDESKIPIDDKMNEEIDNKILQLLSEGNFTSKEIVEKTKIDWSVRKLINYLKKHEKVQITNKKSPMQFGLKYSENKQESLFQV